MSYLYELSALILTPPREANFQEVKFSRVFLLWMLPLVLYGFSTPCLRVPITFLCLLSLPPTCDLCWALCLPGSVCLASSLSLATSGRCSFSQQGIPGDTTTFVWIELLLERLGQVPRPGIEETPRRIRHCMTGIAQNYYCSLQEQLKIIDVSG